MAPREVLENSEYDVVVLGGEPSGCAAAAAAARNGARTLLIEATGALRGMGTAGLVPCCAVRQRGAERLRRDRPQGAGRYDAADTEIRKPEIRRTEPWGIDMDRPGDIEEGL